MPHNPLLEEDPIITSENSRLTDEIEFSEPVVPPVFDISKLNPFETPTEPQEKAQSLTNQLQELNLSLIGESAFRAEREEARDIAGLTQTRTDLSSQLKILQAEALAIPQQTQLEAEGRGITAGGLRPITTGRLRENAIKALTTSALLEAANNNLATSLSLIDRAVAQKFDPIREEIDAKTANLQLILRSPEYTNAEKKRAQDQLDEQNRQKAAVDEQEAEQKAIWKISTDAANKGLCGIVLCCYAYI